MRSRDLPVAVIGGGPIGLTAAALLAERDIPFVIFERGERVGESVLDWQHVRFFTPWKLNVDPIAAALLGTSGWDAPNPESHPTGGELVERFMAPLARTSPLAPSLRMTHEVIAVTRHGIDKLRSSGRSEAPFEVLSEHNGSLDRIQARAVIDATGTWRNPNPLNTTGLATPGEVASRSHITYGIPDVLGTERSRFSSRRVAVVGSGHSARQVVRDLTQLRREEGGGSAVWVTRRTGLSALSREDGVEELPERTRLVHDAAKFVSGGIVKLVAEFAVTEVVSAADGVSLVSFDGRRIGPFDRVVAATGFRPDTSMLSELRVDLDSALESSRSLAPLIDPDVHYCASVPLHGAAELSHQEPDLFVVGAKSYGRAPTFLLYTGYHQLHSVVSKLERLPGRQARLADADTKSPGCGPLNSLSSCCSEVSGGCSPADGIRGESLGPDEAACHK